MVPAAYLRKVVSSCNIDAQFLDWSNFTSSYKNVRKKKKDKPNALLFHDNWEENLVILHEEVIHSTYVPGGFTVFPVYEPRERIIEAPMYRDRIIHHAIHAVAEPVFEKSFIKDSYACRKGKGTHAAVQRVQYFLRVAKRSSPTGTVYILQMDIKGYFSNIVQAILKGQIFRYIPASKLLNSWHLVINQGGCYGVGQPIGALTSQLGANIYLNDLDHLCKDELGLKYYVRYMDDFLIIHHDKDFLNQLKKDLEAWLQARLELKISRWSLKPYTSGVDFAGYRTWPTHIKPRKRNVIKAKRDLTHYAKHGNAEKFKERLASLNGYLKHCNAYRIKKEAESIWFKYNGVVNNEDTSKALFLTDSVVTI